MNKKKIEKTQEQKNKESLALKNEQLNNQLKELKRHNLPKALNQYKVNEEVQSRDSEYQKVIVKEVVDDGKILLCEFTHNDGKRESVQERYVPNFEIMPKSVVTKETLSFRDTKKISFHNQHLSGLLFKHFYHKINYDPIYQRGLCWNLEDKVSLINSIFNNIEIGKFSFITLPYSATGPDYEVLDGKQRLNTLIEFYLDGFKYQDRFFSELSVRDKNHFLFYSVTAGDSLEDWSLEDKMAYFLKMNVAGVPQSKEHLNFVQDHLNKLKSK